MSIVAPTTETWQFNAPGGKASSLDDKPENDEAEKQDPGSPPIEATDDENEEFDEDDFDDDFDDNFEDELEDDFEDEFEEVSDDDLDDGDFGPDGDDDEEGGPVEFEEDEDF